MPGSNIFASMNVAVPYKLNGNTYWLSHERCLFWEEQNALVVSDLHFGKTGHFRKAGIAIPQNVFKDDLQRLLSLVMHFKPELLIIVGDMFHSVANKELELFQKWRNDLGDLQVHLVKGNHDILPEHWYNQSFITVHNERLQLKNISFIHDCNKITGPVHNHYHFCGHIHPGICLKGLAKQSLSLPCFYFGNDYAVLPAFSHFTGLALIHPKENETVFAIVDKEIIQLSGRHILNVEC